MKDHLKLGSGKRAGRETVHARLHRRRERVHLWSKPCRRLPLAKRAQCERGVDAQVLQDKTWVPMRKSMTPAAFTLSLDHD